MHFGVTFSNSGMTATMHEKVTGNWYEYSELDGGASYRIDPVADRYRGEGLHLGNFFPSYDRIEDDGYTIA